MKKEFSRKGSTTQRLKKLRKGLADSKTATDVPFSLPGSSNSSRKQKQVVSLRNFCWTAASSLPNLILTTLTSSWSYPDLEILSPTCCRVNITSSPKDGCETAWALI